jgi:hypothetical protein
VCVCVYVRMCTHTLPHARPCTAPCRPLEHRVDTVAHDPRARETAVGEDDNDAVANQRLGNLPLHTSVTPSVTHAVTQVVAPPATAASHRQPPPPATAASHRRQPPPPAIAASHRRQPPPPATAASHRRQPSQGLPSQGLPCARASGMPPNHPHDAITFLRWVLLCDAPIQYKA